MRLEAALAPGLVDAVEELVVELVRGRAADEADAKRRRAWLAEPGP
jgi:hypothetical protein